MFSKKKLFFQKKFEQKNQKFDKKNYHNLFQIITVKFGFQKTKKNWDTLEKLKNMKNISNP